MPRQEIAKRIAAEMRATRRSIEILVKDPRSPGLSGISRKEGGASVDAILDDLTRGVARVIADFGSMDYQTFLRDATGNTEAW